MKNSTEYNIFLSRKHFKTACCKIKYSYIINDPSIFFCLSSSNLDAFNHCWSERYIWVEKDCAKSVIVWWYHPLISKSTLLIYLVQKVHKQNPLPLIHNLLLCNACCNINFTKSLFVTRFLDSMNYFLTVMFSQNLWVLGFKFSTSE